MNKQEYRYTLNGDVECKECLMHQKIINQDYIKQFTILKVEIAEDHRLSCSKYSEYTRYSSVEFSL